jgi:hypothetical protein
VDLRLLSFRMRKTAIAIALLLGFVTASTRAAIDMETSVPPGWTVSGAGSLGISADHYRLGSRSLEWSWQGGDVLTASGVSIDPAKVLDFYQNTCSFWLYSDRVTPGGLTIEFLDGSEAVQWRFEARLNFHGWRHIVRSYRYDMQKLGGGTELQSVRFTAPATGSGSIFLDEITWVGERIIRYRDRVMPDVGGYYSTTLWHDLDQLPPDLPAAPATPEELAALPGIEAGLWPSLNASAPSATAVTTAKNTFASWNILRSGSGIKGVPVDRASVTGVDGFLGTLARAWFHLGDNQARDMAIDTIEHLIDQGWAGGSGESTDVGSDTYRTREMIRALVMLRDTYQPALRAQVKDLLWWRLKRGFFWDASVATHKNTDFIYTESLSLMGLALGFADTDQEKVENLRGLRQYFERFLAVTSSTTDGIKPDGTGFHHWNHYNNYMYAFGQLAERLYLLRNTPFMVDRQTYETFRAACEVMALMCNDTEFANSLCGRKPSETGLPISASSFARLAKAGGPFYGGTADPELARFHNRVWGGDADLLVYGYEAFPTGFWQFNFSPAAVYRHGSSVVTIRGLTDTFWGTEIYADSNRYGRYQAYGTVEVMRPGGRTASGFGLNGWDWNCPPGSTVIRLPFAKLKAVADRQDERADTRFCGALAGNLDPDGEFGVKGSFGVFGMMFRQRALSATHNPSFTFRKSVFTSEGILLCLGSDIANDDSSHETVTNLFQVSLPSTATATNHLGDDLTDFPSSDHWTSGDHWLVDHLGTGFYVPGGQDIHLERQSQSSPPHTGSGAETTGNFAKAWLSHGTAPTGGTYHYLVVPESDAASMRQLATEMAGPDAPFSVLQQDAAAHIVDLRGEGARAYVCFGTTPSITHGPVAETSGPALLVTRQSAEHLVLSYANPQLSLDYRSAFPAAAVTTDVRLQGEWAVFSAHPQCQLVAAGPAGTTLRFTTSDGNPVEVGLVTGIATPGIIGVSADFSQEAGALIGWFSSGAVDTIISRTTQVNDGSGGDGVTGDGALFFDTFDATRGNEQVSYTFGGTMDPSESYTLDIATCNPRNNYNSYHISLWNKTDGVLLVDTGIIGQAAGTIGCLESRLVYTPKPADQGDVLELRITENHNNAARDVAIDAFSLNVSTTGSPFVDFMASYPGLVGSDSLPGADPDGDGLSNIAEFMMGGTAPNDGGAAYLPLDGVINGHLALSLLVPIGASFSGSPSPSATIEGVGVRIVGSVDFVTYDRHVEPTSPKPGLPGAPAEYEWHTFRLSDPISSQPSGFLRVRFESP